MGKLESPDKSDKLSREHQPVSQESLEFQGSFEETKDYLFDQYMKQQLLEDFFDSLAEYVDDENLDQMRASLVEFDERTIYSSLALPYELRERMFRKFSEQIGSGIDPEEVMRLYAEAAAEHKFSVGYHTSPLDIRPDPNNGDQWLIKGTEKDHRDDDRVMAYYSTKYRHLYKRKDPKFVYIIRIDPETHKTDGNWSRADSLSVIARVPFEDVVNYVENTTKKMAEEK